MGDIDVLVLNASLQYRTPWEEITAEACYEQLNCNFISSMLLIQAAVPYMKKNGRGRIVTIGSVQETKPHPYACLLCKQSGTDKYDAVAVATACEGRYHRK